MKLMIRKHFSKLDNNRGSLLLITYFVIVILVGFSAAFSLVAVNDAKIATRQKLNTIAFHIAEAGIERALFDLKEDFINGGLTPSWADGTINTFTPLGPTPTTDLDPTYYTIPYSTESPDNTFNGGTYDVELQNVAGQDHVWAKSTGTINGVSHTISIYVKMIDISPWNTAIFAGSGASGTMVNGNVDIRGSVHILGNGLNPGDFAVDLGGTAELVGNNYNGLDPALEALVPALPTTVIGADTVETLNAELRVKQGLVGLSGSSTVGEGNIAGNAEKETVDGVYVTEGWGGNQGTASVYSDNGASNAYDLGDAVAFPSLSDPYGGQPNYRDYLVNVKLGHVVNSDADLSALQNIDPNSTITMSDGGSNYITMDGDGNMEVSGVVVIDSNATYNGNLIFDKDGNDKTITYSGKGILYVAGNVTIGADLITSGANSFPNNVVGILTPNDMTLGSGSQVDIMGLFYAENQVVADRQTDIIGTIVSNFFNMGTNVPAIYQVPETVNNLPPGLIGANAKWYLVVAWIKS